MNKTLTVVPAIAAGFLGGIVTRYVAPPAAFAQTQAPATKEVRAESFALVDSSDHTVATFTVESGAGSASNSHSRRVVLRDAHGHTIWSAGGSGIQPVTER